MTSTIKLPRLVYPTPKAVTVGVTVDGRLVVDTPFARRGLRHFGRYDIAVGIPNAKKAHSLKQEF